MYASFISADRLAAVKETLSKDLADSSTSGLKLYAHVLGLPNILRDFMLWIAGFATKTPVPSKYIIFLVIKVHYHFACFLVEHRNTPADLCLAVKETYEMINEYAGKMRSKGVDALITPGSLFPAPLKVNITGTYTGRKCK